VNAVANSIDFTIPASSYTGTVNAAGPVDASGNGALSVLGASNQGSLITELFAETTDEDADPNINSLNGTPFAGQDTLGGASPDIAAAGPQGSGVLGPVYDSAGVNGENMASGDITPQFSRAVTLYDAQGTGHEVNIGYLKTGENQWAVEIFALNEDEVSTTGPNGQIAAGDIVFNGDASLQSVSTALTGEIEIQWTNGAEPSLIEFDWGTSGLPFGTAGVDQFGDTDGLSQFDGDYNVRFLSQNGAPVGELNGITIDDEGFVIASFSNGESQSLFKLPLADFANPNGLQGVSGNVYAQTADSGDLNLREAKSSGVGEIVSGALENSNVDLAEQLTDLIVAQRTYQSNTRTISTSDELLELLTQI
jgi:flagellar hook protein FlgE